MTAPAALDLRQTSPARSEDVRAALKRLVADVFDLDITPLDRLGHDPSVVSFGWWRDGDLVANVSLYRQTLTLMGERVDAFGVQSVATRPEWRRRGLFRDLMTRALAYADARCRLVLLTTGTPALYRPFGFRPIAETWFAGPVEPGGCPPDHRRLSLASNADLALVRALFRRRVAVSDLCAATDHPALFLLKAATHDEIALVHLPGLDAIVAVETPEPDVLVLRDIVAAAIPPLAAIVAALGGAATRARVLLTPDKLAWAPTETTRAATGWMARGPYAADGRPIMLTTMHI
jgi:predicted N-acetyltransferase YhbS